MFNIVMYLNSVFPSHRLYFPAISHSDAVVQTDAKTLDFKFHPLYLLALYCLTHFTFNYLILKMSINS